MNDKQFHAVVASLSGGMQGFMKDWGLRQFADAVQDYTRALANKEQEAGEATCKLCNSSGYSTPCAYPTEINRQQAQRIAQLEQRLRTIASIVEERLVTIQASEHGPDFADGSDEEGFKGPRPWNGFTEDLRDTTESSPELNSIVSDIQNADLDPLSGLFSVAGPSIIGSLTFLVGDAAARINPDGTVDLPEGFTPNAAALAFWNAVQTVGFDIRKHAFDAAIAGCMAVHSEDTEWDTSYWNQAVSQCMIKISGMKNK